MFMMVVRKIRNLHQEDPARDLPCSDSSASAVICEISAKKKKKGRKMESFERNRE